MKHAEPAIPLFGDAYLADTRHLSLEEHGAYLQLMMIAWRIEGCRLQDDDVRIARMLGVTGAKWAKLKPVVTGFWKLENGYWTQARLTKEREFVDEKREKNRAAAEARWDSQPVENKQSGECKRISERNAPPPLPPISTSEAKASSVSARKAKLKISLPEDWKPRPLSAGGICEGIVATWQAGRMERELSKFRDHHLKSDARWSDWDAAWRSWIQRASEFERGENGRDQQVVTLRGNRPDPSLDFLRQANADLEAERRSQTDRGGDWPALPAHGPN